jgi:hypothetical protein
MYLIARRPPGFFKSGVVLNRYVGEGANMVDEVEKNPYNSA